MLSRKEVNWFVDHLAKAEGGADKRLQEKNAKLLKVAEAAENRRKNCLYAIEDGCLHESALHSALAAWKRER